MRNKQQLTDWVLSGSTYRDIAATVPGDVLSALYGAGCIDDPYFADNFATCAKLTDGDWTYTTQFDAAVKYKDCAAVVLTFEGIDTLSVVTLNGSVIFNTDNMFLKYECDIKKLLRATDNVLTVSLNGYGGVDFSSMEKYSSAFGHKRLMLRKAQCHFGWDWAPDLPGLGIFLPVYLTYHDGARITEVLAEPKLCGDVFFQYITEGAGDALSLTAQVFFNGAVVVEGRQQVTHRRNCMALSVEDFKLWWPNGSGEQNLYTYRLTLYDAEVVVDTVSGSFGFKQTEIYEFPTEEGRIAFSLKVNGRIIFAKGSNWVPISNQTGAIPDESYTYLLEAARDAGYNMLRVWGGGIYEKDIFYRKCDELGILVWQDFMLSCSEVPEFEPDFCARITEEAEYQLKRLGDYTCIALYCAGNELSLHPGGEKEFTADILLRGLTAKYYPQTPYLSNSPHTRNDNIWDTISGDSHISCFEHALENDDVPNFRRYIDGNRAQFYTENTSLGCCRLKSLKKFLPDSSLSPDDSILRLHFSENPYAIDGGGSFADKEKRLVEAFFGFTQHAADAGAWNIAEFAKYSNIVHGEIMQAEAEYARMNPDCKGFLNWMYNDNWGNGTWAVIDWYGEKKAAYYAQKRAFANVLAVYGVFRGSDTIAVINGGGKSISERLLIEQKNTFGKILRTESHMISLSAGETAMFDIDIVEDGYIALSFGGEKRLYYPKLYGAFRFNTDLRCSFSKQKEQHGRYEYKLEITAGSIAKCVFIDYPPASTAVSYSDNYFDIDGGDTVTVYVRAAEELDTGRIVIKTIADEWTE